MRGFTQVMYEALLRLHGLIIIALAGAFFVALPDALERGFHAEVPVVATSIAALVAILFVFQRWLPVGFREPERGSGVFLVLIAHFVLAFLFVMVGMTAVISSYPDAEEISRPLSILIAAISLGLSGFTWLAALLLGTSDATKLQSHQFAPTPTGVSYTRSSSGSGSGIRAFFLAIYRLVLQSHGLAMLIFAVIFMTNIPEALERGLNIQMHAMIGVLTIILAICYIIQRGLPDFFLRPSLGFGIIGSLACHAIFGLIFFILLGGFKIVVLQETSGERNNTLISNVHYLTYLVSVLAMLLTLILGLTRKPVSRISRFS